MHVTAWGLKILYTFRWFPGWGGCREGMHLSSIHVKHFIDHSAVPLIVHCWRSCPPSSLMHLGPPSPALVPLPSGTYQSLIPIMGTSLIPYLVWRWMEQMAAQVCVADTKSLSHWSDLWIQWLVYVLSLSKTNLEHNRPGLEHNWIDLEHDWVYTR